MSLDHEETAITVHSLKGDHFVNTNCTYKMEKTNGLYDCKVVTNGIKNSQNGARWNQNKTKKYPKKQSRTSSSIEVTASIPKNRETLRWCGWGFTDSGFSRTNGVFKFTGNRYMISGKTIPYTHIYLKAKLDIDVPHNFNPRNIPEPKEEEYPVSKFTEDLLDDIKYLGIDVSAKGIDRIRRSGGQAFDEIWRLIDVSKLRIPDAVAWPTCHEECVELVNLAHEKNFVIIPYGGGTSVTGALTCVGEEQRPILSVDTNQMNEILCVDEENLLVTAESGIIGADLEAALRKKGYTTGHDPDSLEISTLGGWVSTRASGMKKSKYGNIEDMVIQMKMVTPNGVIERGSITKRMSCGPDLNHLVLGSEGMFGIITEVTMKIHPVPEHTVYDSALFPDYATGIKFMRELAKQRLQPANIRLMDNEHLQSGWALRIEKSIISQLFEDLKMKYLEKVKGFDLKKMSLLTLVHEGEEDEVEAHLTKVFRLVTDMGGIPIGRTAGKGGYAMSVVMAYIRDIGLEFNVISESIEATVAWDKIIDLNISVKHRIMKEAGSLGLANHFLMTRLSQVYDTGCCYYIILVLKVLPGADIVGVCNYTRRIIKEMCIASGASISHHHGIGKQKREWLEDFISVPGANILRAVKQQMDPKNIFGSGNILEDFKIKNKVDNNL